MSVYSLSIEKIADNLLGFAQSALMLGAVDVCLISVAGAGLLTGVEHLTQTRRGLLFAPPDPTVHATVGLVLAFAGCTALYLAIVQTWRVIACMVLAGLAGFLHHLIALHWLGEGVGFDPVSYNPRMLILAVASTFLFFPWWMAAAGLFRLVCLLWDLQKGSERRLRQLQPLIFASSFTLADVCAGDLVYGIPLGTFGAVFMDTAFESACAVIGLHGSTFMHVRWAAEVARLVASRRFSWLWVAVLPSVVACAMALPTLNPVTPETPAKVRFAALQLNHLPEFESAPGDGSQARIDSNLAAIAEGFDTGAQLVILPECAFLNDVSLDRTLERRLAGIIQEGRYLIIGDRQLEVSGSLDAGAHTKHYNAAHLLDSFRVVWTYRKSHLVICGEWVSLIARLLGIKVLAGRGEEITAGNGLDPVRIGNMPPRAHHHLLRGASVRRDPAGARGEPVADQPVQ